GIGAEGRYPPLFNQSAGNLFRPDSTDLSSAALLLMGGAPESDFHLFAGSLATGSMDDESPAGEAMPRETSAEERLAREILTNEIRTWRATSQEILVEEPMINMSMVGGIMPDEAVAEEVVTRALPDLVCLSHMRWDFVYRRPQHLMSRSACERRVFFVEEPVLGAPTPRLDISPRDCGVVVVVPRLPGGLSEAEVAAIEQSLLLDELFLEYNISDYILWYYTPMAVAFTWHLEPLAIVYDCMDELSAFKFAPPSLKQREAELLSCADVVFTGGYSLYE